MTWLTDEEFEPLKGLPVESIVDLAAELDIVAPDDVDRRGLLDQCIGALVEHAVREGLPFSKYDEDDLAQLAAEDLAAIGRLQGLAGTVTVSAILKQGQRVYKTFEKRRIDHPIPLMLPMLLTAVARAARSR
ncbi:MAG: hypothetical protein H6737_22370 [Alphaproteobacteria bacterium]|nr:hypothetical protein [Alphaproteobacteria bacterium]